MTRRGFSDRLLVWVLYGAVVITASMQVVRWVRRPSAPIFQPPVTEPVVAVQPPRDTTAPFLNETVGPTNAPISTAAVSPTGRLVATLDDSGEVMVWDVRARTQIRRFASELPPSGRKPSDVPIAIQEQPGMGVRGAIVAIGGDDGILRAWNAQTGERILTAPHSARDAKSARTRSAPLVDAVISAKGRLISVSGNGSLAYWSGGQSGDSALIGMSRGPTGIVRDVDVSPNGRALAVVSDDAIYLSTLHEVEGRQWRTWAVFDTRRGVSPQSVHFSHDGTDLASVWSDGEIRLHFLDQDAGWRPTLAFAGEPPARRRIAISRGGGPIAATDGDRGIQIWWWATPDTATIAAQGPIRSMWFATDGRSVVVADGDRYLRSIPVPAPPWQRR